MNKDRNQQIDTLAKKVFRDLLSEAWVINDLYEDFAKDYHVETADENGDLTGTAILVQLKGQEKVEFNRERSVVRFSLETKYATYFLDKVKDLPVFLVVVDVNEKKAWFVHIQPILDKDQAWRKQKSVTIKLPAGNVLSDTPQFSRAITDALRKMRQLHPESIRAAVKAQIDRMHGLDPRFEYELTGTRPDGGPVFQLRARAKERIEMTVSALANNKELAAKLDELFGYGKQVTFKPGEIRITGSKLFEEFERLGGTLSHSIELKGTVTFVCKDKDGKELSRLPEVTGSFTGGLKSISFHGSLAHSPFSFNIGPIVPNGTIGASLFRFSPRNWNGQKLRRLAYFDRLYDFLRGMADSVSTELQAYVDGNPMFTTESQQYEASRLTKLNPYLSAMNKARKVCERFIVDPTWTIQTFNADAIQTAEELYGVFFENGHTRNTPHFTLSTSIIGDTFRPEAMSDKPGHFRLVGPSTYTFLNEIIDAGKIAYDMTESLVTVKQRQRSRSRARQRRPAIEASSVPIVVKGSANSITSARIATEND